MRSKGSLVCERVSILHSVLAEKYYTHWFARGLWLKLQVGTFTD